MAGLPRGLAVALAIGAALPAAAPAQEDAGDLLRAALSRRTVAAALDRVGRAEERAVTTLTELASIVSPSGHEHERAAAAARRMRAIGLAGVTVDSTPNAWGTIPGTSGRALVFVTMLDDLPDIEALQRSGRHRPRREGSRVVGPATEIQSTVAAMLVGAEATQRELPEVNRAIARPLAVALHGERGGDRGTVREWADIPAMMNMARQVVLLAAVAGGQE